MPRFEFLRRVPPDVSRYLPRFTHRDSRSLSGILSASSWEHEKQRLILKDIVAQWFVETATWGLPDWERVVEVRPNPGDTYQQRRNRILLKLNGTQTSTVEFLERITKRYISEDCNVRIRENAPAYTFEVVLTDGRVLYADDLIDAIELYKPAHLGYGITIEIAEEMPLYMGLFMADSFTERIDIAPLPDTAIIPVRFSAFTANELLQVRPAALQRKEINPLLGAIMQALYFERIRPKDFTPLEVEFGEYLFPFSTGGFFSDDAFGRIRARMPTGDSFGLYAGAVTSTLDRRVLPAVMGAMPGPRQGIGAILQWLRLGRLGCDLSDVEKMAELGYLDFPLNAGEYFGTLAEDAEKGIHAAAALRISTELVANGVLGLPGLRFGCDARDLARMAELTLFDEDMALDMPLGGILFPADCCIQTAIGPGMPPKTQNHIGLWTDSITDRLGNAAVSLGNSLFYGTALQWLRLGRLGCDLSDIGKMAELGYSDFHLQMELREGMSLADDAGCILPASTLSMQGMEWAVGTVLQWHLDRVGCDTSDLARMAELGYLDFPLELGEYFGTFTEDEAKRISSVHALHLDGEISSGGFLCTDDRHIGCDMADMKRVAELEVYDKDSSTGFFLGGLVSIPDDRLTVFCGPQRAEKAENHIGLYASEVSLRLEGAVASYQDDVACIPILSWTLDRIGCDLGDVDRMKEWETPDRLTAMTYTAGFLTEGVSRTRNVCRIRMQLDEGVSGILGNTLPKKIICDLSDLDKMAGEDVETFILAHQLPYILG